jgi:hypothetical protein
VYIKYTSDNGHVQHDIQITIYFNVYILDEPGFPLGEWPPNVDSTSSSRTGVCKSSVPFPTPYKPWLFCLPIIPQSISDEYTPSVLFLSGTTHGDPGISVKIGLIIPYFVFLITYENNSQSGEASRGFGEGLLIQVSGLTPKNNKWTVRQEKDSSQRIEDLARSLVVGPDETSGRCSAAYQ